MSKKAEQLNQMIISSQLKYYADAISYVLNNMCLHCPNHSEACLENPCEGAIQIAASLANKAINEVVSLN